MLLVATGRRPEHRPARRRRRRSRRSTSTATSSPTDTYRTSVAGVWAFGDVANHFQLKHMANAEMRVVAPQHAASRQTRGRSGPTSCRTRCSPTRRSPAVGLTEAEARRDGDRSVVVAVDTRPPPTGGRSRTRRASSRSIADPATPHARSGPTSSGPQAAILLQPLLQAMMLGQTVDQLAHDVLYIHPALTEVVEQALLDLSA